MNCRKDRLLTIWKPLKNTCEEFLRNCWTTGSSLRSTEAHNLPLIGVLQNHCVKNVQICSVSPYSVWMVESTDQKKLRLWALFTQWIVFSNSLIKTHLMHYVYKSSIFSKNQIFRRPLYKSTSGGLLLMFYFSSVFLWCNYSMTVAVWYLRFIKCCLFILFPRI